MKKLLITLILVLYMAGPSMILGQEKYFTNAFKVLYEPDFEEPEVEIQLSSGDKDKIATYNVIVFSSLDGIEEEWTHQIKVSHARNYGLIFWIAFGGLKSCKVRFHMIWSGPEFIEFTTDWQQVKTNGIYYVGAVSLGESWTKGVYTLAVLAEISGSPNSGANQVETCKFRIY